MEQRKSTDCGCGKGGRGEPMAIASSEPGTLAVMYRPPVRPMAYFSSAENVIYVDPVHRREIASLLRVEIDSQGLWCFEEGDPPVMRQAKEEDADVLDPVTDPKVGDFQILDGRCVSHTYNYDCVPINDTDPQQWLKTEPPEFKVGRCTCKPPGRCREDFKVLHPAKSYSDPGCSQPLSEGNFNGWECLEL